MSASTTSKTQPKPAQPKAEANGSSDGQPELTAAEQLAAAKAAMEQIQKQLEEATKAAAQLEAEERARILGEALAEVDGPLMEAFTKARKEVNFAGMIAALTELRNKVTTVAREQNISTRTGGGSGTRNATRLPDGKSIPALILERVDYSKDYKISDLVALVPEASGNGAVGAAVQRMCQHDKAVRVSADGETAQFRFVKQDNPTQ